MKVIYPGPAIGEDAGQHPQRWPPPLDVYLAPGENEVPDVVGIRLLELGLARAVEPEPEEIPYLRRRRGRDHAPEEAPAEGRKED